MNSNLKIKGKQKVLIIAIVLFVLYAIFPVFTESIIVRTFTPVIYISTSIKTGLYNFSNAILSNKIKLLDENQDLKFRNDKLSALILEGVLDESDERFTGFVVLKPPQTRYDKLTIRHIHNPQIKVNNLVYDRNTDILIGKVLSTSALVSSIELFSSPAGNYKFQTGDFITTGVGTGAGGLFIEVPANLEVEVGDPIYYPHKKEKIIIGDIQDIEGVYNEAIKQVFVDLLVNPFLLTEVWIDTDDSIIEVQDYIDTGTDNQ